MCMVVVLSYYNTLRPDFTARILENHGYFKKNTPGRAAPPSETVAGRRKASLPRAVSRLSPIVRDMDKESALGFSVEECQAGINGLFKVAYG